MNIPIISSRFVFSRENQIKLFLLLAFPINFWALLLWFRDIEFITERTNFNDAIGGGGYVMLFALVEILIIYTAVNLFALILPKNNEEPRVLAQIAGAYLVLSLWLMFEQALHLFEWTAETFLWRIQYHLDNLTNYGILAWGVMAIGMVVSIVMIGRSEKLRNSVSALVDRIILLSGLYIIFNVAGIAIVITRNIS